MDFEDSPEEAQYRAKVRAWLEQHKEFGSRVPSGEFGTFLDADVSPEQIEIARQWQKMLYDGGLVGVTWPKEYGGQGGTAMQQVIVGQELGRIGAPGALDAIGLGMAGPTILSFGTEEQKKRYIAPLLKGEENWCQLFSEPGAGSDLGSLETKAVRDGDDYVVNGQKVWTSGAHYARWAILVTRTEPNVPKHEGLTYFVMDMQSPGVTPRPLRQISGGASFNEVFLDNVRIPRVNMLGKEGQGWAVAMTTLMFERMSSGGGGELFGNASGANLLKLLKSQTLGGKPAIQDAAIRQQFARVYVQGLAIRYSGYRRLTALSRGQIPGPEASAGKFLATDTARDAHELALMVQGPAGALLEGSEYTKVGGNWQRIFLELPGMTLAAGSDEILKNIVSERVLGMPQEPRVDKGIAFKDLPRGTMR